MASIEFIQKRIAGKEKEIEKITKKIERIRKAEATGWEVNPYYYSERDLKSALRELAASQEALEGYKAQLSVEREKAQSRNVPAILEFLERWKARNFQFYESGLREAFEEEAKLEKLRRELAGKRYGTPEYKAANEAYQAASKANRAKHYGYFRPLTEEEKKQPRYRYEYHIKIKEGEWEHLRRFFLGSYEESIAKLQRELNEEAGRKYDFIVERATAITGKITNAEGLKIGAKEELNGYIVGERGTAKIQTIGAGGYNIQCFHFRTLVNELK